MPTFDNRLPELSRKSLIRRECRASSLAQVEKIAMPAQSLLHLRAVQVGLYKDFKSAKTTAERVSVAGALVKVAEMRRVLLRIPAPGRDTAKPGSPIEVPSAQILDEEPCVESPTLPEGTEQAS